MATTLAECELYAAVAHWITSNGHVADYRMLVEFPATGISSVDNIVEWRTAPSQLPTEQNLIDAYNAFLTNQTKQQTAQTVEQGAETLAAAIPQWASWTEAQALEWHNTNISTQLPVASLAAANVVLQRMDTELKALIRMNLALRNKVFPKLQG